MYKCNTLCYHPHLLPRGNGAYITQTEQILLGLHYNMECNSIELCTKICVALCALRDVIMFQKSAKLCTKCAQFFKHCSNPFMVIIMEALYNLYESTLNIDGRRLVIFNLAQSFPCLIRIFPDPLCVDS